MTKSNRDFITPSLSFCHIDLNIVSAMWENGQSKSREDFYIHFIYYFFPEFLRKGFNIFNRFGYILNSIRCKLTYRCTIKVYEKVLIASFTRYRSASIIVFNKLPGSIEYKFIHIDIYILIVEDC